MLKIQQNAGIGALLCCSLIIAMGSKRPARSLHSSLSPCTLPSILPVLFLHPPYSPPSTLPTSSLLNPFNSPCTSFLCHASFIPPSTLPSSSLHTPYILPTQSHQFSLHIITHFPEGEKCIGFTPVRLCVCLSVLSFLCSFVTQKVCRFHHHSYLLAPYPGCQNSCQQAINPPFPPPITPHRLLMQHLRLAQAIW